MQFFELLRNLKPNSVTTWDMIKNWLKKKKETDFKYKVFILDQYVNILYDLIHAYEEKIVYI